MDSLSNSTSSVVTLSQLNIMILAILATISIVLMWWVFWNKIKTDTEKATDVLMNPSFFKTVAVIGVIAAVAVLSLAGRLEGNITGAILSGIVGYVLGQSSGPKA